MWCVVRVSIPTGSIKTRDLSRKRSSKTTFQFLQVRLRLIANYVARIGQTMFQFLQVRLRLGRRKSSDGVESRFNSYRFD